MTEKRSYTGIDYMRLIAALLIVTIHTSPLSSYTETGDFILTRIIARIAVPFFFMTSGFFLISRYNDKPERLKTFIKRTCAIYAAAIVIYLPINVYNGYFEISGLMPKLLKDILIDGTLYHLWYLPASVTGAVIAWYFVRRMGYKKAMAAALLLYLIGLFGDSYYGIVDNVPYLGTFYDLIFQVTDYTRNGLFMAPVFFIMGGYIADKRRRTDFVKSVCGAVICFVLMFGEAMALRSMGVMRHDSMYIFLLPCMYFFFSALLYFTGKRREGLRTLSLAIYLIHPMAIVAVRLFAKLLGLQSIFIENSLMHFLAVCAVSVGAGVVITILFYVLDHKKDAVDPRRGRAYLEVDLENLKHNINELKGAMQQSSELMAVVKAEAYGHGMYEIATYAEKMGVGSFAVATIDEGIELRRCGISGEILVLGYTDPSRAGDLRRYDIMQTVIDREYSELLNAQGYRIKAHIKIDTGMHRLGFDDTDVDGIISAFGMKNIDVHGIYTHLCVSDSLEEDDVRFTSMQIERFYKLLHTIKERGIAIPKTHIQSSYGLLNYPELKCDYVRAGIAMYGVLSSPNDETKLHLNLKPVLSVKSRVVLLRSIKKGESAGYGRAFIAEKDSVLAMIPIGYADGLPRSLSCGRGAVLINGCRAPIAGRVCMDQLAVDVTDIPKVEIGADVTLIGADGEMSLKTPEIAGTCGSISNELLSRMGRRLNIVVK